MTKYKSAIFKHLHEEMQTHLKHGGITAAELADFEKACFKDAPAPQGGTTRRGTLAVSPADTSRGRVAHQTAISAANPGPQGRNVK